MLKNKAQIAQEGIKTPPRASRALERAQNLGRKDFGLQACDEHARPL